MLPNKSIQVVLIIVLAAVLAAAGYWLIKSNPLVKTSQFADSAIVFSGSRGNSTTTSIFTLDPSGKVTQLSPAGFSDALDATFSPDLKKIAFVASHDDKEVIAVMDADGNNALVVSKQDGNKTMPSWSKDGKNIIYALSRAGGGVSEIDLNAGTDIVVNVGTDVVQTPVWMPDGSGFGFMKVNVDQNSGSMQTQFETYKNGKVTGVDVNGDKSTSLSDLGGPAISPDGTRVAFVRNSDSRIYISTIDGKNLKLLTDTKSIFSCPSWSKDGNFVLASESDTAGKNYISKVIVKTGEVTRSSMSGFGKIICPREVRY